MLGTSDHTNWLLLLLSTFYSISESEVDWRIHPGEISQSTSHGSTMCVLPGSIFSSVLGCDSLCLSSDGLGHLNQCFSHFSIHLRSWVDRHLHSNSLCLRRSLISPSRCFSNSHAFVSSCVNFLIHAHTRRKLDARMTQNVKALNSMIKSRTREDS